MPVTGLSDAIKNRMDYLIARQGVVAGNIANADTPGYLAKDIDFKAHVQAAGGTLAMAATQGAHMGSGGQTAGAKPRYSDRFVQYNGNAVRLDNEMLKMQETQLNYRMMTQIYAKQVAMQKIALGRGQ